MLKKPDFSRIKSVFNANKVKSMFRGKKFKPEKKYRLKFIQYVGDTPILPIKWKILTVFVVMILLSIFSTNLITVMLSQRETIKKSNIVLVDKLVELYNVCNTQKEVEKYSRDTDACLAAIAEGAMTGFEDGELNSVAFGMDMNGSILFFASPNKELRWSNFLDKEKLAEINKPLDERNSFLDMMRKALEEKGADIIEIEDKISEERKKQAKKPIQGAFNFVSQDGSYNGVYKYHDDWRMYIVRANKTSDAKKELYRVVIIIVALTICITTFFVYMGTKIFDGLLKNIDRFSNQMYEMQQNQVLVPLDIEGAPNDDITYLAANFNRLSFTINNLLHIFQKFVPENVVRKAHQQQEIKLEGRQRELTILFSDIKSFTFRTEVLGNDIIGLLNVHYDSVIKKVSEHKGIIGSIIGDAILASYGIEEGTLDNKSFGAIKSAWEITAVTADLRRKMSLRRQQMEAKKPLTEMEEKVYQAVMLDVGVGIDGGNVFYGNIGSSERMANTVIGDNVNSASRLEGLTRIYKVPVIVSEYIRDDAMQDPEAKIRYEFFELDTVQVKGKTEGVKIYIPLDKDCPASEWNYENLKPKFDIFEKGLITYYEGDWKTARAEFKKSGLPCTEVFLERMGLKSAPDGWSGIWTMTSK
ncbi:MAG: adenylate/guanylate cyclase domain-containing protein [Treponema sp.]|nr:adenylate/guanylate cyclase domain-containing protein [Spirochaetia bacterium]MDY5812884.1 adenylate/guanylate cyclase domain-containing protein [Treponema sp.]